MEKSLYFHLSNEALQIRLQSVIQNKYSYKGTGEIP